MIYNNDFIEGLKADSYKWFIEKYEEHSPIFPQIAEEDTTDKAYVQETSVTGGGRLDEKLTGQEYVLQNITEAWTPIIRIREHGNRIKIEGSTMEDIKGKAGDLLRKWVEEWGTSARQQQEFMVADLFSYGGLTAGHHDTFDNSDPMGAWSDPSGDGVYDGTAASPKPFFNLSGNERTAKNGDTYFNMRSTLTLNGAGIENLYELIAETNSFKENGEKCVIFPDLLLVGTPTQEFSARRILESTQVAGSAMNDTNVIKNLLKIVRNPFLSSEFKAAGAFVVGTAKKGVKIYSRIKPAFEFYDNKDDNTFRARIRVRNGSGVTNWKFWAANGIPTS